MKMKLVILWLSALALPACGDLNPVDEFRPYISAEFGFRVDYPANWQSVVDPAFLVGERPDQWHAVMFLSDPAAGALFTVFVQQLDGDPELAAYAEKQIAAMRSTAGDAVYSDLISTRLGGLNALETRTRLEQGDQALTQRVVLTVQGGRGYGVSLTAPEGSPLIATLNSMLLTFSLLP